MNFRLVYLSIYPTNFSVTYPTNFSVTEPRFGQFMARFPVRQAASGEIAEVRRCRQG